MSEEIRFEGGKIGILMLHGFTGSPSSIYPWAQALHHAGYTIHAPLLPGHGTTWMDLNTKKWPEIFAAAEKSFSEIQRECDRVFVAGFSVGGALALRLAQLHGDHIEALLLCNPALFDDRPISHLLGLAKHFIRSTHAGPSDIHNETHREPRTSYNRIPLLAWDSIKEFMAIVREDLYRVENPTLVTHSKDDHVIHSRSSEAVVAGISSQIIREVIFQNSYHNVSLDYDSDLLNQVTIEFIQTIPAS